MKHGYVFLILGGWLLPGLAAADGTGQLIERLRVNHAAMVSSEKDFHEQQRQGRLNAVEADDYAAYVARLHLLVAQDCAELAEAGVDLPPELGCPVLANARMIPADIDQQAEKTPDEQIAALDAELLGGLGDFDEMLLREQQRVRAQAPPASAADGAGGSGSGNGNGDGNAGGQGADGAEEGMEAEGSAAAEQTASGAGDAAGGMGGPQPGAGSRRPTDRRGVPRDIPDGDDDDIVARQLREAAEKETSPELKEKLWEEYRKYKKGTR